MSRRRVAGPPAPVAGEVDRDRLVVRLHHGHQLLRADDRDVVLNGWAAEQDGDPLALLRHWRETLMARRRGGAVLGVQVRQVVLEQHHVAAAGGLGEERLGLGRVGDHVDAVVGEVGCVRPARIGRERCSPTSTTRSHTAAACVPKRSFSSASRSPSSTMPGVTSSLRCASCDAEHLQRGRGADRVRVVGVVDHDDAGLAVQDRRQPVRGRAHPGERAADCVERQVEADPRPRRRRAGWRRCGGRAAWSGP